MLTWLQMVCRVKTIHTRADIPHATCSSVAHIGKQVTTAQGGIDLQASTELQCYPCS